MKIGRESSKQNRRLAKMYVAIDDYYLSNGMAKTVKFIEREYGYTTQAAAKLFHEVVD